MNLEDLLSTKVNYNLKIHVVQLANVDSPVNITRLVLKMIFGRCVSGAAWVSFEGKIHLIQK